jgi:hypothetical protein
MLLMSVARSTVRRAHADLKEIVEVRKTSERPVVSKPARVVGEVVVGK